MSHEFSKNPAALDQQFCWHPFTPMEEWCAPENPPLILSHGRGATLYAQDGTAYLDGNSSIWTNLHGHCHPLINEGIRRQLEKFSHVSFLGAGHAPAAILAEKLCVLTPGKNLCKAFFSDNGSTAIEVALKLAVQFWQQNGAPERSRFVAFDNAYHGDTVGAASVGGVPLFHERFSTMHFPVDRVSCVEELENLPDFRAGKCAAVLLEPLVQGVNRMHLWPKGMLRQLRRLCDETGTFLILDEILTGFGRTGTMFACEQEDVCPDFLCLAKGLTGGYLPLAATLTTQHVFDGFLGPRQAQRTFFYGHSYTANPLGCAAALANLSIFESEPVLEKISNLSELLSQLLAGLPGNCPFIKSTRQIGVIAGMDLSLPDGSDFPATAFAGHAVCKIARNHGLLTRNIGDTITLLPPYCTTPEELERMVSAIRKAATEFGERFIP